MAMSMAQSQTIQFAARPQAQTHYTSMPQAAASTSAATPTPTHASDTLAVRAARLRAQLSRETNASVQSYLAGELASVEEWQKMGYS